MLENIILYLGIFAGIVALVLCWVDGIGYMKSKHPDYKGEDFLGE